MSVGSRSWSLPAERDRAATAAALALVIFLGSWVSLHYGWLRRGQIADTPVYQHYGDAMARGHVPYRDFSVEYPPGALPTFVLPSLGNESDFHAFRRAFEAEMWASGAAMLLAIAAALGALRAGPARLYATLALAAVSPLLLGSVVLSRYDLWPTALTAGALAALLARRFRLGHGLLGIGIAAKLWPGVLLPLAVVQVWRTRGRREALVCLGVLVAVLAAIVVPFVAVAPHGVWETVVRQSTRPLQVESLGAALLVASHHLFGTGVTMVSSHGSQNVGGHAANVIAALQTVLQGAALVAIWSLFARRRRAFRDDLVQSSAAAVVAFVALGKVLSPQFLIWLIPFVPLVRRRSSKILFVGALVLTQAWFPHRYWDYALHFNTTTSWLVLARDVVLLALLGTLVVPQRRTWDGQPIARTNPIAVAVVVRRGDEYLLLHRAHEGPDYAGEWAWGLPAGARHPGEDVEACARRELREETGLELPVRRTDAGDEMCMVYVAAAPLDADVELSREHDAFRWLPLEDAVRLCSTPPVAEQLRAAAGS